MHPLSLSFAKLQIDNEFFPKDNDPVLLPVAGSN